MRAASGISGSKFGDCMLWLCCPFCAGAQELRTALLHPRPGDATTVRNYQATYATTNV